MPRNHLVTWRQLSAALLVGCAVLIGRPIAFAAAALPELAPETAAVEPAGVHADEPTEPVTPSVPQVAPISAPAITSVTFLTEAGTVGIDITAPVAFAYKVRVTAAPSQVVIDFPDANPGDRLPPTRTVAGDVLVRGLRWAKIGSTGTRLVLDLAYAVPNWTDSGWNKSGDGLFHLAVKAKRQFVEQTTYSVARGVKFGIQKRGELYGPVVVNMLAVWLREAGVRLEVGLGKGKTLGKETVSSMVRRTGAVAGINASFFHTNGLPLGLIVENGMLVSVPVYDRTAFIILDDGSVGMDRAALRARVAINGKSPVAVNGFNRTRKKGEIVVYNQAFGPATPTSPSVRELVVREGKVVGIGKGGTPLMPGVTVVAGDPQGYLQPFSTGNSCLVSWDLALLGNQVQVPGTRIRFAMAGGPRLVVGGRVSINATVEQFRSDVTDGRAPRTAIGITADGALIMVTVDGRQEGVSVGMTLQELAALMIELGAVDAMNLDGGGSTTMVIRDRIVNMPSDGGERAVGSALLVFAPGDDTVGALRIGMSKSGPTGL